MKTSETKNSKLKTQNWFYALFLSLLFFPVQAQDLTPTAAASPKQINKDILKNKKGLEDIERKLRAEKKKQQLSRVKERSTLTRLQQVDQVLGRLKREKEANQEDLTETRRRLDRLKVDIAESRGQLSLNREVLLLRLRALYRMSFRTPFLGGALGSESSADLARRLKFQMLLAESNGKLLSRTLQRESQLETSSSEWSREQDRQQRILGALGHQEKNYSRERQNRSVFLTSIRRQQVLRQRTISELNDAARELHEKVSFFLRQAEEAKKKSPAWVPAGTGLTVNRGRVPWPVSGKILSPFGRYRNPEFNVVVDNTGIQIQAPNGTPFRAVASGVVRYADWFKGYGKLVILDHGRGYYSLYAQAAGLDVVEGQTVASGQVLGTVGDTGSLVGNSLYFEIRKDGTPQDPLRWLQHKL